MACKDLEAIGALSTKAEKLHWKRNHAKIVTIMERLSPIEQQIIELQNEKIPLMDEITKIREGMVSICVHPQDFLIHHNDHIYCKFCERKLSRVTPKHG